MPEPIANPLVDLNNARNLPRTSLHLDADGHTTHRRMRFPCPPGTVLERPEGEALAWWQLFAKLLEREVQARRQSDRKQRRKRAAVCSSCGYHYNQADGICTKCGTPGVRKQEAHG